LFFLTILAVVGYGLYVSIMRPPESASSPPPGAPQTAPEVPKVEIPGTNVAESSLPPVGTPTTPPGGNLASSQAPPGVEVAVSTEPGMVSSTPAASPGAIAAGTQAGPVAPDASLSPSVPPPASTLDAGPTPPGAMPPGVSASTAVAVAAPAIDKAAEARNRVNALLRAATMEYDRGQMAEALQLLSPLYGSLDVPPEMTRNINEILDRMAGVVIYSREHRLEKAYQVQPGDTLERIAEAYNVTPTLLARINGIREGQALQPGRDLKVVRGPFSALVSLKRMELTLMLQDRYAGRFQIGTGLDHPPVEGIYAVREKVPNRPPEDNIAGMNPWGRLWIGLGNQIAIHGTNDARGIGQTNNRGSICLSDRDIDDVYGILSVGSKVVIQR
jgi:hypothetical protein